MSGDDQKRKRERIKRSITTMLFEIICLTLRRNKIYTVIASILISLPLTHKATAAQNTTKPDTITLQLTWYPQYQFAGYYAAKFKGYYKDEGLDVTLKHKNKEKLTIDCVLSGDADFGTANSDLVYLRMKGAPVVVLAVIMQHSPWCFLVKSDSGIITPGDLIGKNVAMEASYRDVEFQAMFKFEKIPMDKINIIKRNKGIYSLQNGTIDALSSYLGNEPFDMANLGFETRVIRPINYGIDFYGDTLFTTEQYIEDNPEKVERFRSASLKGWRYAMEHPEETADYILKTYYSNLSAQNDPTTRKNLLNEWKVMDESLMYTDFIEIGHMNPYRWQRIYETYTAMGMTEPEKTLEGFIYDDNPQKQLRWLYISIGGLVGIAFVGVIAWGWNKRLKILVERQTEMIHKGNRKNTRLINNLIESFFFRYDSEKGFNYISSSITMVLGYSVDDFCVNYSNYLTSDIVNATIFDYRKNSLTGKPQSPYELEFFHANGQKHWFIFSETPVYANDGSVTAIEGIAHDVSKLKSAEQDIRNLQSDLSCIINSMPSVLISVDLNGIVTQWNKEAEHVSLINDSNAIGKPLLEVFPRLKNEIESIFLCIKTGEKQTKRKTNYQHDGNNHYEDITIFPLISNKTLGAVIRIDDITNYVRLENIMVESEKMQSVGGLAAGMAHEINNPLGSIMQGYQNILRRISPDYKGNEDTANKYNLNLNDVYSYLEERQVIRFIEGGRKAGEKASQIIKNILQFSRTASADCAPVDLEELMERAIELGSTDYDMKRKFDFKFVTIERDYDPELPKIPCCPNEIEQVMLNLFKNGLQATEEIDDEGYKPHFHLRLIKEKEYARIEIEDNGPGMPETVQSRIFEPFFTTKPLGTGTGLGLSVSYMIITQNHHGKFEVESKVGRGTKFIIYLPFHETLERNENSFII